MALHIHGDLSQGQDPVPEIGSSQLGMGICPCFGPVLTFYII